MCMTPLGVRTGYTSAHLLCEYGKDRYERTFGHVVLGSRHGGSYVSDYDLDI
jgi:hypothetical protein